MIDITPAASEVASRAIVITSISIHQDSDGRFSLNDLHTAAVKSGANKRTKEPSKFLSSPQTIELIAELVDTQNAGIAPVSAVRGGLRQGTYVCKELVYAYAMWVSPKFHLEVIRAYDQMQTQQPALPKSLPEALRLAADLAEKNEALAHERDEAVRTKSMIGSRREATAMATASAAKREANKLRHELGRNQHHATILAVEQVTGQKFPRNAYVSMRSWCKSKGINPVDVVDERYGMVKAWPAGAWLECHDIDLALIFGKHQTKTTDIGGSHVQH